MIERDYRHGGYVFYCDICKKHTHRFSTFENALKHKKKVPQKAKVGFA